MKEYQYKVQGVDYTVCIEDIEGNIAKVTVNDIPFEVEMPATLRSPRKTPIKPVSPVVTQAATTTAAAPAAPAAAKPAPVAGAGKKVLAPLPGTISKVCVTVGQQVHMGDTVVVLEAMKMQNNIEAESNGEITSILVNKGDAVMEGTALVTIG